MALSVAPFAYAESSSKTKHNNSEAPKEKEKLKVGAFVFDVTGRIEGDVRSATPALGLDAAEPQWQDRRLGVKGTAFKRVNFEVSRELGQDFETSIGLSEKTAWRDVYARVRLTKTFSIQAGHFKLPFGYEELTGETDLDFIYRSLASRVLAPGRDTGVMVDGRLGGRRIEYAIG